MTRTQAGILLTKAATLREISQEIHRTAFAVRNRDQLLAWGHRIEECAITVEREAHFRQAPRKQAHR